MSSLIKSLALLIAIVSLAVASYASLVNGESPNNIPGSLSELGVLENPNWLKVLRFKLEAHNFQPDKILELLKKVNKIYAALDDDAKTNRNEQKIVEQFEINQIDVDEFCTLENLLELEKLGIFYSSKFSLEFQDRESFLKYLNERERFFAFVCRPYVLEKLNKRVGDLDETDRPDIEQTFGNMLMLLSESDGRSAKFSLGQKRIRTELERIKETRPKWIAILLEYLKEKSGNNLDAKSYITTDYEGERDFDKLFWDSVVGKCLRLKTATDEAKRFQAHDRSQKEDYTDEQASWMKYADVCQDITFYRKSLNELLYIKLKSEWSKFPTLRLAMNKGLKKMTHSGAKSQ